jgi:GMP synthase (glutamine-hydrolysing)
MSSDACANQAFLYNDRVLALQFHFEMTEDTIKEIINHSRKEIVDSLHVEPEERMISQAGYFIPDNNARLEMILDRLAKR